MAARPMMAPSAMAAAKVKLDMAASARCPTIWIRMRNARYTPTAEITTIDASVQDNPSRTGYSFPGTSPGAQLGRRRNDLDGPACADGDRRGSCFVIGDQRGCSPSAGKIGDDGGGLADQSGGEEPVGEG